MTEPTAYLTDRSTLRDDLSFSDFSPALGDILTGAQTPLTLGVFGPWGSGKTSLLRMLQQQLEQPGGSVRTVWFTAWKYDRQEALWRAFILRVLDGLYPRQPKEGLLWERRERVELPKGGEPKDDEEKKLADLIKQLDRLEQSVYRPVDWQEVGRLTADWSKLGPEAAKAAGALASLFVPGGELIRGALTKIFGAKDNSDPDLAGAVSAIRREVKTHHRDQLLHMEQFEADFKQALELALPPQGRLVVFVDDLDRCLPEKAVEVLEAIKLFLEVPNTVFVLGMDAEVIERGIEVRYRELLRHQGAERAELPLSGASYLQKIVQIPFHLPPLAVGDTDAYIQALEQDLEADARLTEITREVFALGVLPNPRQVKRALNIFRLLRQIADKRGTQVSGPLLAKTVLIQTQWPELYQQWRQVTTLPQSLEQEYAKHPVSESELVLGRAKAGEGETEAPAEKTETTGGILGPFIADRARYGRLAELLGYPPPRKLKEGEEADRFDSTLR